MSESRIIAFGLDVDTETLVPLTVTSGALNVNASITSPLVSAGIMGIGQDTIPVSGVQMSVELIDTGGIGVQAIRALKGNQGQQMVVQQARSGNFSSSDFPNVNWQSAKIFFDVIALANPITLTIEGRITGNGQYSPVLVSAAIAAPALVTLRIGPTYTAAANLVAQDNLPAYFRFRATTTGSWTAGIYADFYI